MNYQKSIRAFACTLTACLLAISLVPLRATAQNQIAILEHPDALLTQVFGVNNSGTAVGSYTSSDYRSHGFLWMEGQFTASIDAPNSRATYAYGVNNSGAVAGNYFDYNFRSHGFVMKNGSFMTIDYPSARHTLAYGVNDRRQVFGSYVDDDGVWHGFIYDDGTFTPITVTGAYNTFIYGGNNHGQFSGAYNAPNGPSSSTFYGLLGDSNGLTSISYGVAISFGQISNNGTVVGNYTDGYVTHGVIYRDNNIEISDVPGAISTILTGVNDNSWTAGTYTDASYHQHAFISIP